MFLLFQGGIFRFHVKDIRNQDSFGTSVCSLCSLFFFRPRSLEGFEVSCCCDMLWGCDKHSIHPIQPSKNLFKTRTENVTNHWNTDSVWIVSYNNYVNCVCYFLPISSTGQNIRASASIPNFSLFWFLFHLDKRGILKRSSRFSRRFRY